VMLNSTGGPPLRLCEANHIKEAAHPA
jgi:hypothetical protein